MYDRNAYQKWNRRLWGAALLVAVLFGVIEWHYNIVERGLGRYLVWKNAGREKFGPQWEKSNNRLLAGTRLEHITSQLRESERQLETIRSFDGLLQLLAHEQQKVLPPAQFERIYSSLPFYLKPLIIAPDSLIAFGARGALEQVYCVRGKGALEIFFLDTRNEPLSQARLAEPQLEMIARHGKEQIVNIETHPSFSELRIWSLAQFLRRLQRLPYHQQQNFLQALPAMVELASPATRVAISNKISDNLVEVAVAPDNVRAYIYYVPEEWVNDLVSGFERDDYRYDQNKDLL